MKKLIGIFSLVIILFSCTSKDTYRVKGTVSDVDLNGQVIFLTLYDNEGVITSDSVKIQNNKFSFTGKINVPAVYYIMMDYIPAYKGEITQGVPVFIEPGTITVDIIGDNLKIGGNPDNEAYQKVLEKQFEMMDNVNTISNEFKDILFDYLKNNIHTLLGQEIFRNSSDYFTPDEIGVILEKAPEDFKYQSDIQESMAILSNYNAVSVDKHYVDFSLPDINGQIVSLSDYVSEGKYVLVDFWASWCAPCMKEIPYLKATYDHFGKEKFEIIGVSLDYNKEEWLNALKNNNMNWVHLSDLDGCESAVQPYFVTSIPYSILIDSQGIIVAKNLRGEDLEKKLADIIKG